MNKIYHTQVTTQAIGGQVSPRALAAIIAANHNQDSLQYLLGRYPHFHWDDNLFAECYTYLTEQKQLVLDALTPKGDPIAAWQAWGRMTHLLQDFYSHSNYLTLWAETYAPDLPAPFRGQKTTQLPPNTAIPDIDPLIPEIIHAPRLMSGRVIYPWEAFAIIPPLVPLLERVLPEDCHTNMNLDYPKRGWLFAPSLIAAQKRTTMEFELLRDHIVDTLGEDAWQTFTDK